MHRLSPADSLPTTCPRCQATHDAPLRLAQVRFCGAVTVVDTQCPACNTAFYQTLPNGQFNRFPVALSADGRHVSVAERGRWLLELVRKLAAKGEGGRPYAISPLYGTTSTLTLRSQAILLLCLDACYGHALLMLFDAQRHHEQHPDRPIIAVVPRTLGWLVPDYVAEIWIVEAPLAGLHQPVAAMDAFIKQQLNRFTDVWFSAGRIHFDHRTTRFSDFTRTRKFDLTQFSQALPRLTFVLREDRLWLRHGWERWLHKALTKLGLERRTRPFWARWQAMRYRQITSLLVQKGIVATTVAVGLTDGGQRPVHLGDAIHDDRQRAPLTPEQERSWCEQYANSHIVVGVHGSGMLLPTSLAAGFVCLLPPDKLAHYAEDILMAHDNPVHQTLLGRFLPTSASPKQVAELIGTMLAELPVWLAEEQERQVGHPVV